MGQIQGQINQLIGTASIAAGIGKHAAAEAKQAKIAEQKNQADIDATQVKKEGAIKNFRNDTLEAAEAISAHEKGFKHDIEFKNEKGEVVETKDWRSLSSEEKANLQPDQVQGLADAVEKFREGKLTTDRISRMEQASEKLEKVNETKEEYEALAKANAENRHLKTNEFKEKMGGLKKGDVDKKLRELNPKNRERAANIELKKAYESFRELNDRITSSRELKFDISAAEAKLDQLRGGKK